MKELNELQKRFAEMTEKALENPEQFVKEMGIDINNFNVSNLKDISSKIEEQVKPLENLFKGKEFKNLNIFHNKTKHKPELNDSEKLDELGKTAFDNDLENKAKFCFIGNDCDREIIKSHSIQKNGELSLIAENGKVFHYKHHKEDILEVDINQASAFKGFCHKHDQIFEPIDKKQIISDSEKYFLYSLRSFAYSYHNVKSFQDYGLNLVNNLTSSLNPLIDTLNKNRHEINKLMKPFGVDDSMKQLNNGTIPKITEEQKQNAGLVRFEKQRKLLLEYIETKSYDKLEYLIYDVNHLCPIVCSSWMTLHINLGNNFIVISDGQTPYYAIPLIISVIPFGQKTKIILARFKEDQSGSDGMFNFWKSLISDNTKFETEISKLIIENVENFYLSPKFWNKLSEEEQNVIKNAVSLKKNKFPEQPTNFEMLNLFDEKYKITQ